MHEQGLSYGRLGKVLALPKSTLAARGRARRSKAGLKKNRGSADQELRLRIREIKVRKPTWGIRRVRAWVRKSLGIPVGRKRTARLLREERLRCPRIKKREYRRLQPRSPAGGPNQV